MLVSSDKCLAVFQKVKQIKEHKILYCLSRDHIPVSIEDLEWVIGDMYKLTINKEEVSFEADFLRGMLERYENGNVRILIWQGQAIDWKRFVTTKELLHLVIDEEEDWSPEGSETIDQLLIESALGTEDNEGTVDNEVQSEVLAEIAAIEILYPYEFREADVRALNDETTTYVKLAMYYEIPEFVVSQALHPQYLQLCQKMWDKA